MAIAWVCALRSHCVRKSILCGKRGSFFCLQLRVCCDDTNPTFIIYDVAVHCQLWGKPDGSLFNVMLDAQQIEVICEAIPKTQVQILQLEWNASDQPDKGNQAAAPNIADTDVADTSTETPRGEEDHSAVYAQLLGANSPVVFLSLRSNAITSDGATEIANALCSNTKLQSLNLFQNRIGDDGALAIAHALPQNGTLKTISVANNGITGKG